MLEAAYGVIGVEFEPRGYGPWSGEVECALRRLAGLGLVEELPPEVADAARLPPRKGRRAAEGIPLKDPRWRLPEDVKFFAGRDVDDLVEYIRVNYPEYVAVVRDGVGRPTV